MEYGKVRVFGSKGEYIIGSVMELVGDYLFYEFCVGDEEAFLRAVNVTTGEPVWTYPKRRAAGTLWAIYKDYLICTDQILDARTGQCLFDFLSVPGVGKSRPFFIALDDRRLMFEMNEEDPSGRYFIVDTHTWQVDLVSMGLRYAFLHDGRIYGWVQTGEVTELCSCARPGEPFIVVCRIDLPLRLLTVSCLLNYVLVTSDYRAWLRIDLCNGTVGVVPLSVNDDRALQRVGHWDNKVYFSSLDGLQEYEIDSGVVRGGFVSSYVSSVRMFNGLLYGIESYRDERRNDHDVPFALNSITGERLWSGPSLRNCNHLRVSERGVFVGIAGGKIHYFPAPGYEAKKSGKAAKSKVKVIKPIPDVSCSIYASLLGDPIRLQEAIQRKILSEGNEASVVAVSVSTALGLAAFIEYDDDPDFPQLRLLDFQTDSIVDVDSRDLIDAPMIDDIAFTNEEGKLQLNFRNGQSKIVTLDIVARAVRWD